MEPISSFNPNLRIAHPDAAIPKDDRIVVQTCIDPLLYRYLFRSVLTRNGIMAASLAIFLRRLAEAMKADPEIKSYFDEENEPRVALLLENLNFQKSYVKPKPARTGRADSSITNPKRQRGDTKKES